jgi:translocating chain-associated membrane protein 1
MPPPPAALKKKAGTKNPPIFSQEYLIQNHGDIACGILMVIALGTVVHATSSYCTAFFGPRHNVTNFDSFNSSPPPMFNYGYKDLAMLFSYTLICITAHAIWQEYILDKLYKKLHLSKSKNAKFFESGQLILFYIVSVLWAFMLFNDEGYFRSGLEYLWRDYPYTGMSTWTKLYFIIQLAYWLHNFPELYLQKVRKEDIPARIVYTSLYLITILYAYLTRFWRISLVLLTIHYLIEIFYHASRLAYFYATTKTGSISAKTISNYLFQTWNVVFVIGRLASVVLAWLTFWFGLKTSSISKITFTSAPMTNVNENNTALNESVIISNFNTPTVRLFTLVATGVLQFWLVWNFIQFHMRRRREQRSARPIVVASPKVPNKLKQKQQGLTNGKSENDETIESPVVSAGSSSNKKSN